MQLRKQPANEMDSEPTVPGSSDKSTPSYKLPTGRTSASAFLDGTVSPELQAMVGAVSRAPHVPSTVILDRRRLPDDSERIISAQEDELEKQLLAGMSERACAILRAVNATGRVDAAEAYFLPVPKSGWVGGRAGTGTGADAGNS